MKKRSSGLGIFVVILLLLLGVGVYFLFFSEGPAQQTALLTTTIGDSSKFVYTYGGSNLLKTAQYSDNGLTSGEVQISGSPLQHCGRTLAVINSSKNTYPDEPDCLSATLQVQEGGKTFSATMKRGETKKITELVSATFISGSMQTDADNRISGFQETFEISLNTKLFSAENVDTRTQLQFTKSAEGSFAVTSKYTPAVSMRLLVVGENKAFATYGFNNFSERSVSYGSTTYTYPVVTDRLGLKEYQALANIVFRSSKETFVIPVARSEAKQYKVQPVDASGKFFDPSTQEIVGEALQGENLIAQVKAQGLFEPQNLVIAFVILLLVIIFLYVLFRRKK